MVQTKSAQKELRFSDNRKARTFDPQDIGKYLVAWEEGRPSKWSATFLPGTGTCLLVLGVTLVALGSARNQADLIVLGVILLIGSVVFFMLMYTTVCRPLCHRNQVDTYTNTYSIDADQPEESVSRPLSERPPPYSNRAFSDEDLDLPRAKHKLVPRESVLYAENARQFLATPATTADVNFDEGAETPPPPRIALPGREKGSSVYYSNQENIQDELDVASNDNLTSTAELPPPAIYDASVKTDAKTDLHSNSEVITDDNQSAEKKSREMNSLELL